MPKLSTLAVRVAVGIVAIFAAGLLMNALRDNEIVGKAISGFDA